MPSARALEKKEKVSGCAAAVVQLCWRDVAVGGARAAWHARRRAAGSPATAEPPPPCSPTPPPQYDVKLCEFMDTYDRAFLVHADNVGSKQFMDIRAVSGHGGRMGRVCALAGAAGACASSPPPLPPPPPADAPPPSPIFPLPLPQAIREHSKILMGKNTMMRRSIRLYCERTGNDQWLQLLDYMVGNVGLIFTKGDLNEVRGALGGGAGCWVLGGCKLRVCCELRGRQLAGREIGRTRGPGGALRRGAAEDAQQGRGGTLAVQAEQQQDGLAPPQQRPRTSCCG